MNTSRTILNLTPHIAFIVLIYNLLVLFAAVFSSYPGPNAMESFLSTALFKPVSVRGEPWTISLSDVLVMAGIALLSETIVRAAQVTKVEVIKHGISIGVFIFAFLEFLLLKGFSTSTFMILCFLCLVDAVAGFTISILSARRDVEVTQKTTPAEHVPHP